MASVEVEKLSEHLLKCPVCLETYKTPKVLPCLHTFCQQCLSGLLEDGSDVIACPTCRCETTVPAAGVSALSTNFFINNMLDFLSVAMSNTRPLYCTNCEEQNAATSRCIECMEFLCSHCVAAHRRTRLTKEHEVICLNELQGQEAQEKLLTHRPLYCSTHDREVLKYFCETCDEPLCRECLIVIHREHRYGYLKDVDKRHRSEVHKWTVYPHLSLFKCIYMVYFFFAFYFSLSAPLYLRYSREVTFFWMMGGLILLLSENITRAGQLGSFVFLSLSRRLRVSIVHKSDDKHNSPSSNAPFVRHRLFALCGRTVVPWSHFWLLVWCSAVVQCIIKYGGIVPHSEGAVLPFPARFIDNVVAEALDMSNKLLSAILFWTNN